MILVDRLNNMIEFEAKEVLKKAPVELLERANLWALDHLPKYQKAYNYIKSEINRREEAVEIININ